MSTVKKLKLSTTIDAGKQYDTYDLSAKSVKSTSEQASKLMAKSVLNSSYLKSEQVPSYEISQRKQKKERRVEREKTNGKEWYNMPAGELTEEAKNDLAIIKMRGGLHKDRFYKANDSDTLPKYFQMGKIVDDAIDYYTDRVPRRQQKQTILEELIEDSKVKKFAKKHFSIIQAKQENRQKHLIRMLKKKKTDNKASNPKKAKK